MGHSIQGHRMGYMSLANEYNTWHDNTSTLYQGAIQSSKLIGRNGTQMYICIAFIQKIVYIRSQQPVYKDTMKGRSLAYITSLPNMVYLQWAGKFSAWDIPQD